MKRVLLSGYYGMKNTGDDALLAVTAWGTRKFLKAEQIFTTAFQIPEFDGAGNILQIYRSKPTFKGENALRFYLTVLRANHIVFGGGSVFSHVNYMRHHSNLLRLSGKGPHVAVGVALGPFKDTAAERSCAELLKRLSFIGLRDRMSLDMARSLAPGVRAERTFDLAVLLTGLQVHEDERQEPDRGRRGIGFALCNYERFTDGDPEREEMRRKKIISAIQLLDPERTDEIVLIDFNGHEHNGDRELHEIIAKEIGSRFMVRHIDYQADPLIVLKEIAGLRALVAMRLHAAVFGYMTQTPTIMLSYHPKCLGWAEEIGMSQGLVLDSNDFDAKWLCGRINEILNGNFDQPSLPLSEAQRLAMRNWEWTDE